MKIGILSALIIFSFTTQVFALDAVVDDLPKETILPPHAKVLPSNKENSEFFILSEHQAIPQEVKDLKNSQNISKKPEVEKPTVIKHEVTADLQKNTQTVEAKNDSSAKPQENKVPAS